MAISAFGATAVGFAASGLIASRLPIAWAFYLNALAYAFSAAMLSSRLSMKSSLKVVFSKSM